MNIVEWLKENKIKLIIIILILAIIIHYAWIYYFQYGHYEREIERDYENVEEGQVLGMAENLSYSEILGMNRYLSREKGVANFIDFEVIGYYNQEFEELEDQGARHDVSLIYHARVFYCDALNITYIIEANKIISANNETDELFRVKEPIDYPDILATSEGSVYVVEDSLTDFTINFSNVYLVHLYLRFDDIWGPESGYKVIINQIVVLDEDYLPLLIYNIRAQFEY